MSTVENNESKNFPEESPYTDTPVVELDPQTGKWVVNPELL